MSGRGSGANGDGRGEVTAAARGDDGYREASRDREKTNGIEGFS